MTDRLGPTPVRVPRRARILRDMGLLEVSIDGEGRRLYRSTPEGMRLGHALSELDGRNEWLRALLRKPGG
jgi:hypothetical protein